MRLIQDLREHRENLLHYEKESVAAFKFQERSIVLCGSFNPLHVGHIEMLNKAKDVTGLSKGFFEMTLHNVDKGAIDNSQVINRIQ